MIDKLSSANVVWSAQLIENVSDDGDDIFEKVFDDAKDILEEDFDDGDDII